jgi:polyphenol oxidase
MTLPLLRSKLFPARFSHGFTQRAGGVSVAPYDTMNVGFKWGDDPVAVFENRRRVLQASGASSLFFSKQVHGCDVAVVAEDSQLEAFATKEADATVTTRPRVAVAVIVADCVPVLLADPVTGACAAVHAGWRGTVANVVGRAVEQLQIQAGARPRDILAALGPSIGPCCFEVGPDVVEGLGRCLPERSDLLKEGPRGRPHANLWQANVALLVGAGLSASKIDVLGECTHCQPERFFSFRRSGSLTGQMLGFVADVPVG